MIDLVELHKLCTEFPQDVHRRDNHEATPNRYDELVLRVGSRVFHRTHSPYDYYGSFIFST